MITRVAIVALVAAGLLAGCESTPNLPPVLTGGASQPSISDHAQITAILDDVHAGMQGKRIYKVLAHVSHNYLDRAGRDQAGIRAYLQGIMKRYRTIRITRARPRILIHGDRARAMEAFGTIAEPYNMTDDGSINIQGQVSVYLERVEGAWKIVEWGWLR
jgi:hypothetical protein